jgi:hypothetical protein
MSARNTLNSRRRRATGTLALLAALAVQLPPVRAHSSKGASTALPEASSATTVPCSTSVKLSFGPTVPGDATFFFGQADADCFAWAEFIPLNWPTDGSSFGSPGDLNPVQWENYITQEALYPSNGGTPSPNLLTRSSLPAPCQSQANIAARAAGKLRVLLETNKFEGKPATAFGIPEAFPSNAPAWLGAQNGTNVWYQVLLNPDEESFVNTNQFYNANQQDAYVKNGQGKPIVFYKGSSSGTPVGTIELKAAWMEAPNYNPQNPGNWAHYLLAPAVVIGPSNDQCRSITVALVGLHIIHKTQNQPTWLWATFEHVDNVPGPNNTPACCSFYSKSCQPQQVTVSQPTCLASGQTSPVTVSCTPNTPPLYYLGSGCPAPVPTQVTRTTPLAAASQTANSTAISAITSNYPNSIFQYYQLIDVLWSTTPTQDPTTPQRVPLNPASMTAGNPGTVANTALETYIQNSECTQCHVYAAIAPASANLPWDADFSFAFGTASPGSSNLAATPVKKAAVTKK